LAALLSYWLQPFYGFILYFCIKSAVVIRVFSNCDLQV
jgi:hypothetical protein